MGDTRETTVDKIPMDLAPTPVLKSESPRNSQGAALLRTVPLASHQPRFMTSTIQSSTTSMSTTISTVPKHGNIQRLETIPAGSVMAQAAVINRLTTLPVQANTTTSYHVPRGAAAVANIAVPRSSLATPIIRGTSTLQTIGVATSVSQAGFVRAASPAGNGGSRASSSWLGVVTTQAQRPPALPHNNSFTQNRMTVNTRIVPSTTVSTRPVLLQATPSQKQISLAQPATSKGNMVRAGAPGRLVTQSPRLAPPLRPVVSLHPTAVLVSTPPASIQIQSATPPPVSTRPVSGANMVSIAPTLYNLPTNSFYESSNNFRTLTSAPVTTATQQQRPATNQVQGLITTGQSVRFNPVMVVDPSVHPFVPTENPQTAQMSENCSNTLNQPSTLIKQNASPRPSILRKRDTEGTPGKAAKNLNPLFGTLSVATPSSPPSPPKRPESRGNGGAHSSGGSTTISATSSPGLGTDSPPLKPDIIEEERPMEMSPRKKPRKQQLTVNQMQERKFSDEEMEFTTEKVKKNFKEGTLDQVLLKPVSKRPVISLLRSYRPTWKAKHHHFLRYSDVKPKEEKRLTVSDIATQKNVMQKANGWKIYHLGAQMADISDLETDVFDKLTAMLKVLEKKSGKDGDINRVNELIKGNIQRSKVITDQLQEAKCQVMKLFDHKCQVTELLNRFSCRRSGKKRERV